MSSIIKKLKPLFTTSLYTPKLQFSNHTPILNCSGIRIKSKRKSKIHFSRKKWNKPNNPRTLIKQIFARSIEPDYYTSMKYSCIPFKKSQKKWLFVEINDELFIIHTHLQDPLHEKKEKTLKNQIHHNLSHKP